MRRRRPQSQARPGSLSARGRAARRTTSARRRRLGCRRGQRPRRRIRRRSRHNPRHRSRRGPRAPVIAHPCAVLGMNPHAIRAGLLRAQLPRPLPHHRRHLCLLQVRGPARSAHGPRQRRRCGAEAPLEGAAHVQLRPRSKRRLALSRAVAVRRARLPGRLVARGQYAAARRSARGQIRGSGAAGVQTPGVQSHRVVQGQRHDLRGNAGCAARNETRRVRFHR